MRCSHAHVMLLAYALPCQIVMRSLWLHMANGLHKCLKSLRPSPCIPDLRRLSP